MRTYPHMCRVLYSLFWFHFMTQFWGDEAPCTPVLINRAVYFSVRSIVCNDHQATQQFFFWWHTSVADTLPLPLLEGALDTGPCTGPSPPICRTPCGQRGALFPYFSYGGSFGSVVNSILASKSSPPGLVAIGFSHRDVYCVCGHEETSVS